LPFSNRGVPVSVRGVSRTAGGVVPATQSQGRIFACMASEGFDFTLSALLFLGEKLTAQTYIGLLLAVAAIVVLTLDVQT